MGLLADVFSYGDTLKRRLGGLLSDPAGTVDLGVRRFAEDQNSLLQLMDQSGYTPGAQSVLQTPQDKQVARNELAKKALETYGGLLGATVWHGSPHKFDKFDSSKIGTGEGAQAYGHGLYLADNPTVAKSYQAKVSAMHDSGAPTIAGKPINWDDPAQTAAFELSRHNGDRAAAADFYERTFKSSTVPALLRSDKPLPSVDLPGNLYKVDLPDNAIAKMLDWDKPLSQQPEAVRVALKDFGLPPTATGKDAYNALSQQARDIAIMRGQNAQTTLGASQAGASNDLLGFGIPGIRYLDGGSRDAGAGSSNFVVFPGNEGLLKILERNGSPIP